MTNNPTDDELRALVIPSIEAIYREGWETGYRAGIRDGGSDSTWCDPQQDWEESRASATLTKESRV